VIGKDLCGAEQSLPIKAKLWLENSGENSEFRGHYTELFCWSEFRGHYTELFCWVEIGLLGR